MPQPSTGFLHVLGKKTQEKDVKQHRVESTISTILIDDGSSLAVYPNTLNLLKRVLIREILGGYTIISFHCFRSYKTDIQKHSKQNANNPFTVCLKIHIPKYDNKVQARDSL